MNVAPHDIVTDIETLITKQAIVLESIPDGLGKMRDHYDLAPLLAKLPDNTKAHSSVMSTHNADATTNVFNTIEIEFGRPLTHIEQENIRDWLTTELVLPEVILLALREAVLNAAYTLKYMDRILLNWERRHLKTATQVTAERLRHTEL